MKLTYWQKMFYSAGALGTALTYLSFGTYIQFFYIDILGLKASLVGLGWSFYGIWNAVNDPLAGYLSDHTRTKWGRRIPWIATAFIPLGLFYYLLWVPPSPLIEGGGIPLFFYFMGIVLIFDVLWTIVAMNWTSLFPEMISDSHYRGFGQASYSAFCCRRRSQLQSTQEFGPQRPRSDSRGCRDCRQVDRAIRFIIICKTDRGQERINKPTWAQT